MMAAMEVDPSVGLVGPMKFDRQASVFELSMIGTALERRYRKLSPAQGAMPWGTIDLRGTAETEILAARKSWTGAAFQEYRTAVACTATLRALLECRAPLDLIALATRFPLDEISHVELCWRMAMELGGPTEIRFDPARLILDADPSQRPIVRAAELVVRFFCVGEALSVPLIRGARRATRHALPRAVLGRIVRDEAAHGAFGFTFLDWAVATLEPRELIHVGHHADLAISFQKLQWQKISASKRTEFDASIDTLAWMETAPYLELAWRSMRDRVVAPLRAREIPIAAWTEQDDRAVSA
jgi:hypothetical protein